MDPIHQAFQTIKADGGDAALQRLLSGSGKATGRILSDLGGGRAAVSLAGKVFQLDLGMSKIPIGREVLARMVGGHLQLALARAGAESGAALQMGTVSARGVANILNDFGLPTSITNTAVVSALISAGIPLSRSLIVSLTGAIGEMSTEQAGALAFLLGRGLPVSPSMSANTGRLLGRRDGLGEGLARILHGLRNLDSQLGDLDEEILPVSRRQQFQEHREQLARHRPSWPFPEEEPGEDEEESAARPSDTQKLADGMSKEETERRGSEEARLVQGQPPSDATLAGRLLMLQSDLASLQALLELNGIGMDLNMLMSLTQNTYEALAGERLGNTPKQDPEAPPLYYFSVPVEMEGEDRTLEFLFRQHTQNREDGGDLVLRFELSALGPVRLQLGWREGILTVGVRVEDEAIAEQVEPHIESLKSALLESGFRVGAVQVSSGRIPETLREEFEPPAEGPTSIPHGLDIRG